MKMKLPIKKQLKAARKHMISLICAGVAVAGIVLSYWPTLGWYKDIEAKLDSSSGAYDQINTLLTKQRNLPVQSDPNNPAPLTVFPTNDVIDAGKKAVGEVRAQSVALLDRVTKLNIHVPLDVQAPIDLQNVVDGKVASALANAGGGDDIARATFGRAYLAAIANDQRIMNWPPPEIAQLRPDDPIPALLAGPCLTDADIKAAQDELETKIDNDFVTKDASGQPTADSKAYADSLFVEQVKTLALQKEMEKASTIKVYVEPGAFEHPAVAANFASATGSLAIGDIWTAQLWLWLDEDVATGVAYANAAAHNVTDSPVKQILDVGVKKDSPYVMSGDPSAGNDTTAITPVLDASPSGHVCNGMYDTVQFNVSLDVDASRIADVLGALERSQFITVLSTQVNAVDSSEKALQHYIYGKAPIVHLDLVCEELMLHDWVAKYQPADSSPAKIAAAATAGGGVAPLTVLVPMTVHTTGQ
jgi:hypothetical protein